MFNVSESPIRININGLEEGKISIFEDDDLFELESNGGQVSKHRIKTILSDIENMLNISNAGQGNKVKIAVMGELKAGKSTFVNDCARKVVAYTDICEATAIVSEITYSEQEFVHVIGNDGSILLDMSFEELINWAESQQEKQFDTDDDVYQKFEKIIIGINSEFFKDVVFVDTPGLLSIKSINHDITNKYVAETDYILWVLDCEDLGSKDVNRELGRVKQSGKPIIGIINKVDTPQILDEIKGYIEKEYTNIFEEVFYISALNEWKEIENDPTYNSEVFTELLDYIKDLKSDKTYSSNQTEKYQLGKELELHQRIMAKISSRKEFYDGEIAAFSHINSKIKESLKSEFEHWVKEELFVAEKNRLFDLNGDELKNLYDRYRSREYITEIINKKCKEMTNFVSSKWEMVQNGSSIESSQVLIDFTYDKEMDCNSAVETNEKAKKQFMGNIENGLKAGAGIGVALAGYAAWLGPYASYVTFAGALVPYTIPVALIGAGVGAYIGRKNINFKDIENDAKKKQEIIEDLHKEVQTYICDKKRSDILGITLKMSDHYYNERCRLYREKVAELNFDYEEPQYSKFMNSLKEYINNIEEYLKGKNEDVEVPPEMFED